MSGEFVDAVLLDAYREGCGEAFGVLYVRHRGLALETARRVVWDRAHAEDAVQEAFVGILRALRGGAGPVGVFEPYLVSAVSRAGYRINRHSMKEVPVLDEHHNPGDAVAALNGPRGGGFGPDAGALLIAGVDRQHLWDALETLPPRWKTALWYLSVEGMKPSQLAPLLGLSPNAVVALHRRAKKGLATAYHEAMAEERQVVAGRVLVGTG